MSGLIKSRKKNMKEQHRNVAAAMMQSETVIDNINLKGFCS